MDATTQEFADRKIRDMRAGVKDSDTVAVANRKIAAYLGLTADDKRQIKLRLGDELHAENDRRNRRLCVPVSPKPRSPYDEAKREAQAKEIRRRSRQPVVDLTGTPEQNERTLRRIDAEEARKARR